MGGLAGFWLLTLLQKPSKISYFYIEKDQVKWVTLRLQKSKF